MATTKIIQRTDKKKNGEAPLYLRIYHKGKKAHKALDISVEPRHWNAEKQQVRKSHDYASTLNLQLDRIKGRAKVAVATVRPLSARNIKNYMEGITTDSFYDYVGSIVDSYGHEYRKAVKYTMGILKEHTPDLRFCDITPSFLKGLERWLINNGRRQNTATAYLERVRTLLNRAMRDEVIQPQENPFATKRFKMRRKPTDPTPLSLAQFKKIRDADLPAETDRQGHRLEVYRDLFCFSVYNDGMRLGDVLLLRPENIEGDRLEYVMGKNGKVKSLEMVPAAREIVDKYNDGGKYVFPIIPERYGEQQIKDKMPTYRSRIWRRIKKIGKLVGLKEHLHFHMARNTSAFIALEGGLSLVEIQSMLGHSSVQQTRDYLGKLAPDRLTAKRKGLYE